MNIVYDHQAFTLQQYGGISRYICEIAARIPALSGNNTQVFCPFHVNKYLRTGSATSVCLPNRKNFRRVAGLLDNALGRLLVRHRNDVAIFHETYYSPISYAPRSAKRVLTVHDMIHELYRDQFLVNDGTREFKRQAVERADHIICVSENTRKDLIEFLGVAREKTTVVYHGNSLSTRNTPVAHDARRPFFLYVGHRHGYKNFSSLATAFAHSPVLKDGFSLLCFGGGRFDEKEVQLIRRLGLGDQVSTINGDDSLLRSLYRSATAFVYPSLYEGFGIPPLEAMSYGCPVICSNNSSLPEVVGDAAETFDPSQIDDIQRAIERVVTSSERAKELISRGHKRAALFSWEKCAQETLQVYFETLTEEPGAGSPSAS